MKNRSLSLMLVMSITVSGITPALNAMQTVKRGVAGAMPAWTKGPGFTAAKKWWKKKPLTSKEQAAFNTLKKRVGITAITAILAVLLGAAALYYRERQATKVERLINLGDEIKQIDQQVDSTGFWAPGQAKRIKQLENNFSNLFRSLTEKEKVTYKTMMQQSGKASLYETQMKLYKN